MTPFFVIFWPFFVIFSSKNDVFWPYPPYHESCLTCFPIILKMTISEIYPPKMTFFDPFLTFFSLFWHFCHFCRLNQERTQFGTPKMTLFWPPFFVIFATFYPYPLLFTHHFCVFFSCSFLKFHDFRHFFVIFCHFWQFTRAICLVFENHHFWNIPQNRRFLTVFCHFWTIFWPIFDRFLTPFQKWTLFFMLYP